MDGEVKSLQERRPIHLLPESTVLKIAAGEIVERPCSIVKELIENSIDAGATCIEVRISGGGTRSIVVTDDGCGIPANEVQMALKRHATSKLEKETDLCNIMTLGFRGEALASISAVSQLDLLTRPLDSSSGMRVKAEGGEIRNCEPYGMPSGTTVSVSNLFYNVPARKKFLKSKATEMGHIERILRKIALSEIHRTFLLENEGEIILHVPSASHLLDRIKQLYSRETYAHLIPFSTIDGVAKVTGFISNSHLNFAKPSEIWLFVNGRPIQDRMLQSAVLEGYRTALMERRYPFAVVRLEVPISSVDVNVHPAKAEVRFQNGQPIFMLVSNAIAGALRGENRVLPALKAPVAAKEYGDPSISKEDSFSPDISEPIPFLAREAPIPYTSTPPLSFEERKIEFSALEYLGTLDNTYLFCRSPGAMYVIDQHAAHERVQFEKLRKREDALSPTSQKLLVPLTMEVSQQREVILNSILPWLTHSGFQLESFGRRTFVIRAVPTILGNQDPRIMLMDLADNFLADEKGIAFRDRLDQIQSRIACHSAVRAHDPLSPEKVRALLEQMDQVDLATNCPHGRPTYLRFTISDFERLFGRK